MNKPYVVLRMDLLSRKRYPLDQLIRLVVADGFLVIDQECRQGRRGIYLLKDRETIETVMKKNLLRRYSSKTDPAVLKEELLKLC